MRQKVADAIIRDETRADVCPVKALITAAFTGVRNSLQTESLIVDALRDAGSLAVSLVATRDGEVIGYVAMSPVSISDGTSGWFGLGPLAVVPDAQGRGVGSALVREALQRIRADGAAGCVVLGEPSYYERFGFAATPRLSLPGVPAEFFLALDFLGSRPAGGVRYHDAFSATP